MYDALFNKIESRTAVIGVIGLGYVGLPLVLEFARKGFKSYGIDINRSLIDSLAGGISYIPHISNDELERVVSDGVLIPTTDHSLLRKVDVIAICVPTPLTKNREPDLSCIMESGSMIARYLKRGALVVLESTTFPGTTENELRKVLEKSSLRAGKDFYLAFSPEREDPGNRQRSVAKIPKVLGGFDQQSTGLAIKLYSAITPAAIPVANARTAEAVKLLENSFRSVNIALVNELKLIFARMNIDIWEVIEAAKTKPFGYLPFYPGPGLGGHCIPIDPYYLAWRAKAFNITARLIELAGEINASMPEYVLNTLTDALNHRQKCLRGSGILLIGISYKKDVADVRESPGLVLLEKIFSKGAVVDFYDPLVPVIPQNNNHSYLSGRKSISLDPESLRRYDAVVIVTDHSCIDYRLIVENAQLVVDCRNATAGSEPWGDKIIRA